MQQIYPRIALACVQTYYAVHRVTGQALPSNLIYVCVQGRREAINIGGGGRHVLTNISYDFDQVAHIFPENVVDGGSSKKFSGL
jgi:hypothetical protein